MTDPYTPTKDDKFSFGLWTVGWQGVDVFGGAVRPRLDPVEAVHRLAELGASAVTFHDDDLVPDDATRAQELCRQGLRVGWLTWPGVTAQHPGLTLVSLPREPAVYAAGLYAVLHALDNAGVDRILVSLPPDTEEWLAVRDRLRRASAR